MDATRSEGRTPAIWRGVLLSALVPCAGRAGGGKSTDEEDEVRDEAELDGVKEHAVGYVRRVCPPQVVPPSRSTRRLENESAQLAAGEHGTEDARGKSKEASLC